MNDRPRPVLPRGGDDRALNLEGTGSGRHFKNVALEIRKRTGQDRLDGADLRAGNHLVVDADQTAVAVQRIWNCECIAHRRDISIDKTSPDNDRSDCPIPASDDVVGDESGPLIAKANGCSVDGIDNGIALDRKSVV